MGDGKRRSGFAQEQEQHKDTQNKALRPRSNHYSVIRGDRMALLEALRLKRGFTDTEEALADYIL